MVGRRCSLLRKAKDALVAAGAAAGRAGLLVRVVAGSSSRVGLGDDLVVGGRDVLLLRRRCGGRLGGSGTLLRGSALLLPGLGPAARQEGQRRQQDRGGHGDDRPREPLALVERVEQRLGGVGKRLERGALVEERRDALGERGGVFVCVLRLGGLFGLGLGVGGELLGLLARLGGFLLRGGLLCVLLRRPGLLADLGGLLGRVGDDEVAKGVALVLSVVVVGEVGEGFDGGDKEAAEV